MALDKEEIKSIAKSSAEDIIEGLTRCISAGQRLGSEHERYAPEQKTPVIYRENLIGLVKKDDLKIPHSELAMHTGAAGKDILALFLTPRMAYVTYKDDARCCSSISGLNDELLSPDLQMKIRAIWGPRQ